MDSIEDLYEELSLFSSNSIHTILMGDMNVHEQRRLMFSDGSSAEGRALHAFSHLTGLEEKVGRPTHGPNLLDLVLSDLSSDLKCKVEPGVSDHHAVVGVVRFGLPHEHAIERELFDYKSAPWKIINADLAERDWDLELIELNADSAAEYVTAILKDTICRHVRHKTVRQRVSTHPWLNDRCREAIDARISAKGTTAELTTRDECSRVLGEEYTKYVDRTKETLAKLSSSSKQWWKLSKSLRGRGKTGHGVQPLQRSDGTWARTSSDKAELLADTFLSKSELPSESLNEFSPLPPACTAADTFVPVRIRDVKKVLRKLREDSATGPDSVATQALKKCCDSLARPIALVIRRMLAEGCWPKCWRLHNIVPLYKKKTRSNPSNYTGVHLTSQISKAVKRVLGRVFLPQLQAAGAYGPNQFAYSTGRGHLDALALSVLSWLLSMEQGNLVGLFCSDVSRAFDRVCEERLGAKLRAAGLHPRVLAILLSWLEPRESVVVLDGCASAIRGLVNSVFQGTVLGPPLWNLHYADSALAVRAMGLEFIFADDLNCSRIFGASASRAQVEAALRSCQSSLH